MPVASAPASSASLAWMSSFVNVSIPQPVWAITSASCVPSSQWEMISGRSASSETTPPAFLITCASPSSSPRNFAGSRRASMQVTTARRRPGGADRSPLSKLSA